MEKIADVIASVRSIYLQPGPVEGVDVSNFLEALKSGDESVQLSAITSLAQMGTRAKAALLALTDLLRSDDRRCRWLAAVALKESSPAAGAVAGDVITILNDRNQDLDKRHCAAFALGGFGRWAAKVAVPALVDALKDPERDLRSYAAMALAEIGPAALSAVPALAEVLEAENDGVRLFAACALGNIGVAAETAMPALTAALGDKDEQVRQAAAEALAKIQRETADAGEAR